ncbi:MAG: DUF6537 domain-containing protein, partial [Pseudohongiellaceae bacterium]
TMNQTGLAQKFGAVVSHVRIANTQEEINAVRIPAGDADLLLGCDLQVAAGDETIAKLNRARSHAVVNDFVAVSGDLVSNPDNIVPTAAMRRLLETEVKPQQATFVAANDLATRLLGDSIASNMFLLGFAQQRGLIPVSVAAVRGAIKLNAVAVSFNLEAYEWGRHAASHLKAVEAAAGVEPAFTPLTALDDIIEDRARRLIAYQSDDYAQRFRQRIQQLRDIESNKQFDAEFELTRTAAKSLYKLMAYKDEYEVARLFSDGNFKRYLRERFEGNVKLQFHLAPPLISGKDKSGRIKKRRFPGATMWLFQALAKLRFLRGTVFDPFSYLPERREERNTLFEFESLLNEIGAEVNERNYQSAVELAALPLQIRGFGHIKSANLAQVRVRQANLLRQFRGELLPLSDIERAA